MSLIVAFVSDGLRPGGTSCKKIAMMRTATTCGQELKVICLLLFPAPGGLASMYLAGERRMLTAELLDIDPAWPAVGYAPFTGDHDAVGAMGAA